MFAYYGTWRNIYCLSDIAIAYSGISYAKIKEIKCNTEITFHLKSIIVMCDFEINGQFCSKLSFTVQRSVYQLSETERDQYEIQYMDSMQWEIMNLNIKVT